MLRMKTKTTAAPPQTEDNGGGGGNEWEMMPCGMLVQKRDPDSETRPAPPIIRVRVKFGSLYHEISISSQASFGELKKMLTGPTGLHHEDQKLLFKKKERDSKAFLDISGVKDKSKIVLIEDPISKEKRYLEMRKNAKIQKASKAISEISLEVDRLAGQVSALETVILKGGKMAEKNVVNVIESLMTQLVRLDGIVAEGDVKAQKKTQVERVQKYVETLDELKIKNAMPTNNVEHSENLVQTSNGDRSHTTKDSIESSSVLIMPIDQLEPPSSHSASGPVAISDHTPKAGDSFRNSSVLIPIDQLDPPSGPVAMTNHTPIAGDSFGNSLVLTPTDQQEPSRHSFSGPVVITTQWETFDPVPTPFLDPFPTVTNTSTSAHPRVSWDLL